MKAIYQNCYFENETTPGVVSFFFRLICFAILGAFCSPAHAWQESLNHLKVPQSARQRIEQASNEEWQNFLSVTKGSILGSQHGDGREDFSPANLPKEQRLRWLTERVGDWTCSASFVERQLQTWLDDRCGSTESNPYSGWSFHPHDEWVRRSIAENESFLRFMQLQLAGNAFSMKPEDNIATASWFRSSLIDSPSQPLEIESRVGFIEPSVPTLQKLPISLMWSELGQMPGVHYVCTQESTERLKDIEAAMESVLSSEQNDWKRILDDDGPRNWHRSQSKYPRPDPMEMTFDLSDFGHMEQNHGVQIIPDTAWKSPWKHTEPWSIIFELEIEDRDLADITYAIPLIRQRPAGVRSENFQGNECAVSWYQGRIVIRLADAFPQSYLSIQSQPIFNKSGTTIVAVVYDGLPTTRALRIWHQGEWLASQSLHDVLLRDFASPISQQLEISRGSETSVMRVSHMECYRTALTELELKGWTQDYQWKEWEVCSAEEQRSSREHWAKRIDLQWRYQRESLLFYANSFASAQARCSIMPTLDPRMRTTMPMTLANALSFDGAGLWGDRDRVSLAKQCEGSRSMMVALAETERQLQRMMEVVDGPRSEDVPRELHRIAEGFRSDWDRRKLILALVLSDAWTKIAIASTP